MTQISLGNGFFQALSPVISNQLCTNWFPYYPETDSLSPVSLLPTPGLTELATTAQSINRGGIVFDGEAYVVNGNQLIRITEVEIGISYTIEVLGSIPGEGQVSFAKNNTQICIVIPGGEAFIFTKSTGELEKIDQKFGFGPANVVVYMNGFFILATDTILFTSAINDGTTYKAVDSAKAEADPDDIVTLHVFKNQLYVLGKDIIEVFQGNPSAVVGFPFQRIEGFIIEKGCVGIFAIAHYDAAFVFVGSGRNEAPAVWSISNNTADKISHTAIDERLGNIEDIQLQKIIAQTYSQDGIYFSVFDLPEETFVFDNTASSMAGKLIWHKRESFVDSKVRKWRVGVILEAFGRLIVADNKTNQIGALEFDLDQEYGVDVVREWSSSPIAGEDLSPIFIPSIMVSVQPGISSEGTEATLGLSLSENAGVTYSNEIYRSMGKIGEYKTMLIWQRLGRYERYATLKLTFAGNNRCIITRIDLGTS